MQTRHDPETQNAHLGSVEERRKWFPADDVVDVPAQARWVRVSKAISKQRFRVAGAVLPMATEPVAGCDVEVTQVIVGHAAFIGAVLYVLLLQLPISPLALFWPPIVVIFTIRMYSLRRGWGVPTMSLTEPHPPSGAGTSGP